MSSLSDTNLKKLQQKAYETLLVALDAEAESSRIDDVKELLNIEKKITPEKLQKKRTKAYEALLLASSQDNSASSSDNAVLARWRSELHISEGVHLECKNRVRNRMLPPVQSTQNNVLPPVQSTVGSSGSNDVASPAIRRIGEYKFRFPLPKK
ncbi:hypothetical protein CARUB_v10018675mg [Capsella rubella]|uniref:ENT domain-containing protein n=1 Tax=Capsella rubella TaxID=81985 RepID=R0FRT9_9BRAS|nr:hypothetical protein CARUB_v10018675mg [Capsella rubella]